MSHMELTVEKGAWWVIEDERGETTLVPDDVLDADEREQATRFKSTAVFASYTGAFPVAARRETGFCARYDAPGYLDCTDWVGPFPTAEEAEAACREAYGSDDE